MSPKKRFKWSSHQPVIKTMLALLQPQLVLELGVGNFSTPLLLASSAQEIIHIENDQPWLDQVQVSFEFDHRSSLVYHAIEGKVDKSTHWSVLSHDQQQRHADYYDDLGREIDRTTPRPRLLFVDHFTCLRTLAINRLAGYFDAVIYHDAEHPAVYGYEHIRQDLYDQFDGYLLKPNSSWTGFMIRQGMIDHHLLHDRIMQEAAEFAKTFDRTAAEFTLERI